MSLTKQLLFSLFILLSSFYTAPNVIAQEEILEATIIEVLEEKNFIPEHSQDPQLYQRLRLSVTKGSLSDQEIEIESGNTPMVHLPEYSQGDKVIVSINKGMDGQDIYTITDFVRRDSLIWLFVIFAALTIIIGKWRGLTSLVGMGVSFAIIFSYILPTISSGADPIITAIIGSLLIIPATFYLSHGFNKKTTVAIIGTVISLLIVGALAGYFVDAAKLTGFASEEAAFLQVALGGTVNIRGLLLAGIIIGVLGVLDDITISQSSIVSELKLASPKIKFKELYTRAMNVGQDHISSMVNTLVLVYTGAALPLLLLFLNNSQPISQLISNELIADEIVRTLVGSIGLVLAVPITTLIAVTTLRYEKK